MQNTNPKAASAVAADAALFIREKTGLNKDSATPLDKAAHAAAKRVFDLLFSACFLLVCFPWVWLILGIAIKLSSPGAVFFVQERAGKGGRMFRCYKFRSMRTNDDTEQATANDPRTTRVGRFIRRTNLDELPQFINVLKGDMSVVGPRPHPHPLWLDGRYAPLIDDYMLRYAVKPGITGWAQVSGCRGETKRTEEMEKRVEKDLWYLRNWTFTLDISIILKTIVSMLLGDRKAY
jgi:putative colanic acid biosynthesis UDP-glucose lipid carrier transferase